MTTEASPPEVLVPDQVEAESRPPLPVATIVAICDVLLGDVARRDHRFSWLRSADSDQRDWLPVDAYYPGKRTVVVCHPDRSPHQQLCEELIASHGLKLLTLAPSELPADPEAARAAISRRISALEAPRPARLRAQPAPDKQERERPMAAAVASVVQPVAAPPVAPPRITSSRAAAAQRAARLLAARRAGAGRVRPSPPARRRGEASTRRHRPTPTPGHRPPSNRRARATPAQAGILAPPSLLLGLALAAALCLETYAAVAVALSTGLVLLALGIALDGCARVLGGIAAVKVGGQGWAWACVIVGSPAVAGFSFFQGHGPVTTEPAPLAGVVALLALGLAAIAVLARALGI